MSEIKVKIASFDYEGHASIWVYKRENGVLYVLNLSTNLWQPYENMARRVEEPPPSFKVPPHAVPGFFKAMADAIAKMGFTSTETEGVRGKLQATERHLEDMRTLVFKRKP